jgi:uncharacterized lipoprotein YajG
MKSSRILLPLAVAFGLAGCANPIVGAWRNVNQNGRPVPANQQLTTTFGPFGDVTISDARTAQHSAGSYVLRNDRITITADGHVQNYHYQVVGDELKFDGAGSVVFRRAASAPTR